MPRHVLLLLSLACGAGLVASRAQGQVLTTISQTQHGETNAALTWTSGSPPSTDSDSETLNGPGILGVTSEANNFGITSVAAAASAGTEIQNLADGYLVTAHGSVSGHSNLAAIATGSYSSFINVEFAINQSVDATLSLTFFNLMFGTQGIGGGDSSVLLTEAGGATLFSYTHTPFSIHESTATVSLSPGTYTLRVDSHITMQFAPGLNNHIQGSAGIVQLTVPGPGGIPLLGMLVMAGGRRRRAVTADTQHRSQGATGRSRRRRIHCQERKGVRVQMIREYVRSRLRGRFGAPSLPRAGRSHIIEWWIGRDALHQLAGDGRQLPALHVCVDESKPGRARITIFDPASTGDSVVEKDVQTEAEADELIQRLERIAGAE